MSKEIPFEESFASHKKSKFWSNKNELKPENITKINKEKFWFNCNKCNHEFLRPLNKIYDNKEHCSYCVIMTSV